MVKRVFLITVLNLIVATICAQSAIPASGGTVKNDAQGSVSFTVGQIDYLFSKSTSGNAVAGVQQPFDENTAYHVDCDGVELTVYPNPTSADLYVVSDVLNVSFPYYLSDLNGKIFLEGNLNGDYTIVPTASLGAGGYLLTIVYGDGKDDVSTFKIIKK